MAAVMPPEPTLDQLVDTTATALRALAVGPLRLVGYFLGAMIAAKIAAEGEVALDHLLLLAPAGLGTEIDAGLIHGMIAADSNCRSGRPNWPSSMAERCRPAICRNCWRASSRDVRCCVPLAELPINEGGAQRYSIIADLAAAALSRDRALRSQSPRHSLVQHAAQLPAHAAVHFVKNAGHMPHWAAPNLAADLLLRRH